MARSSEIVEHLQSPQLTDAEGQATGQGRIPFLVAAGRPRWLGYLFYVSVLLMGLLLTTGLIEAGNEAGTDLLRIIGVVAILGSLFGAWEVWRGRTFAPREIIDRLRR